MEDSIKGGGNWGRGLRVGMKVVFEFVVIVVIVVGDDTEGRREGG